MPSHLTCADCAKPMVRVAASLPQGQARCHACRREHPRVKACTGCGAGFTSNHARATYCSKACSNAHHGRMRQVRADDDPATTRARREREAPGLTYAQRKRLLAKWRKQGRSCTYCDRPATTVDHVLPLVRGGTHYEGNLAPACKACNSGKSGWTVIEWRTGKRLAPMQVRAFLGVPNARDRAMTILHSHLFSTGEAP